LAILGVTEESLRYIGSSKVIAVFHNILVGIDGSPASDRALNTAIELAQSDGSRLTILTAVPAVPAAATVEAAAVARLTIDLKHEAMARLEDAVRRVPDDVPVTQLLSLDRVDDAVVDRVRTGLHDLVVIGTRGRGRLSTALFGSVTRRVVARCECPVLVVHADGEEPATRPARAARGWARQGVRGQTAPGGRVL
jgi:nucleotide-binding universal stress UspA family protein